MGPGAEPAPVPPSGRLEDAVGSPVALRLQILSTEHWSLLASRSLAWNESFTRAGMFLSALSASVVALALVAQASDFGQGFRLFALVILPVVLFIGVGTVLRIGSSNYHDAMCVAGMNRIRAGYLEFAPDLRRFFVAGVNDDPQGMLVTMALDPHQPPIVHMLGATPMLIATMNSIVVGAIVALLAIELGGTNPLAIGVGVAGFAVSLAIHVWRGRREMDAVSAALVPEFPTPASTDGI